MGGTGAKLRQGCDSMIKYDLFYHNAREMYMYQVVPIRSRISDALRNHRREDLSLKDALVGWAYMNFPINVPGLMESVHMRPEVIEMLKTETIPGDLPDLGDADDPETWVIK